VKGRPTLYIKIRRKIFLTIKKKTTPANSSSGGGNGMEGKKRRGQHVLLFIIYVLGRELSNKDDFINFSFLMNEKMQLFGRLELSLGGIW